jgi:oligopeptidase B
MMSQFHTYNGYYYITRFETGKGSYLPRKKRYLDAPEEIMFDCNVLAEGQVF